MARKTTDGAAPRCEIAEAVRAEWFRWMSTAYRTPPENASRYFPVWDGGRDAYGRRHASVWNKVADFLRGCGWDPVDFVRAFFLGANPGLAPRPNALLADSAIERYHRYREHRVGNLKVELRSQAAAFSAAMQFMAAFYENDHRKTAAFVIGDRSAPLSALFRYCMAVQYDLPRTTQKWEERAIRQFRLDPDGFRAVWGKLLPENFHIRAGVVDAARS